MIRWYLNDRLEEYTDQQIQALIATLPPQRQQVALRFKFLQGQKESALAYDLLRQGARELFGLEQLPDFIYNEHKKPSLQGMPHVHFNLSHCKCAVICALSDHPVGVDVEQIGRKWEDVVDYAMSPSEAQQIRQAACPEVEFTRLWTRKEAVVKLLGTGLTDDVKNLLLPRYTDKMVLTTTENREKGYVFTIAQYR